MKPTISARRRLVMALLFASSALLATAPASAQAPSRGALLYSTHCIACHNTQMHWRDDKLATDWNSLKAQVRRWQGTAALGWSEEDILEVTRHLNERIYRFAPAAVPLSSRPPVPVATATGMLTAPRL